MEPVPVETVVESVVFEDFLVTESALPRAIPVKIIGAGWGSMAFYPKEVLKRDGPKVYSKGTHMYWNHPTSAEEAARPEGDLSNLAAVTTKDAEWNENGPKGPGLYTEAKVFSDYAQQIQEKGPHIGVSINAGIRGHVGEAEGRTGRICDELSRAFSADFVTRAGAGGAPVVPVVEAARGETPQSQLKETVMEDKVAEALRTENEGLKARILEFEASQNHVVAVATVGAVLREAGIPFRQGLLERACASPVMKDSKPDADWVKAVVKDFTGQESVGRVTGMGPAAVPDADKAVSESLKASLKELGVPEAGLAYASGGIN
jgi:hypothetical protein